MFYSSKAFFHFTEKHFLYQSLNQKSSSLKFILDDYDQYGRDEFVIRDELTQNFIGSALVFRLQGLVLYQF